MKFLLKWLAASLASRLTPKSIDRAFRSLPPFPEAGDTAGDSKPAVCALQVEAKIYSSLKSMVRDIDSYMQEAVLRGAGLVCFPELYGLFTAFASPLVRLVFKIATKPSGKEGESETAGSFNLPELYEPFSFLAERYVDIMVRFARRYGVWISCGSVFVFENGRVFNRHILLNNSGEIAGAQDKLNPVPFEAAMGLSHGDKLTVVETPFGNIALTVCMDATYYETFKIAKSLGADFALVPIANAEPYNHHLALRGAAMRVSETGLAALKPALVSGKGFPVEITGRAGVYYPLGFSQKSRESDQHTAPDIIVERMDIEGLRKFRSDVFCLPNRAFNENLMREYANYLEQ